ncbi:MAG: c-type cytochrome [Cognatishimia sp.]
MKQRAILSTLFATTLLATSAFAEADSMGGVNDSFDDLLKRGEQIYFEDGACVSCHGETAEGDLGPALNNMKRSPLDVNFAFKSVPRMAPFVNELSPTKRDYLALSLYLSHTMAKNDLTEEEVAGYRESLARILENSMMDGFELTSREEAILELENYADLFENWEQKAKTGSLKQDYEVRVLAEWPEVAEPAFTPEPGKTYFYENTGSDKHPASGVEYSAVSSQVVVGDAETKEVLASYEFPIELKGTVHTTFASPDGKYIYISGGKAGEGTAYQKSPTGEDQLLELMAAPASLVKVDAQTLRPVKQMDIGGRIHHGQIFQDKYLLIDTFSTAAGGLDVFLYDPETDTIVGGVTNKDLGGAAYTSFSDGESIYVLMEPAGYDPMSMTHSGYMGAANTKTGQLMTMRNFWIAKLNPETWEVEREYTYPGFRGDWIVFDANNEHMYIPGGGSSNLAKINLETGETVWASPVGIGPYGATLNADETEVWVTNKGETTGMFGRTVTVLDAETGWPKATVFSGYMVDHVLLSPNGKEVWGTSNGEGRLYVWDAETKEELRVIDMPGHGDAHGLVWVNYDENGDSRVVRDQGGFHNGIHPAKGTGLNY